MNLTPMRYKSYCCLFQPFSQSISMFSPFFHIGSPSLRPPPCFLRLIRSSGVRPGPIFHPRLSVYILLWGESDSNASFDLERFEALKEGKDLD